MSGADPTHTVAAVVARLAHLKEEHRGLLARIAADPGMTVETRVALLGHLADEEDELVDQLRALVGASTPGPPGLTVGSLRQEPGIPPARRGGPASRT